MKVLIWENTINEKVLCFVVGKVQSYRAHKYIQNQKLDKENSVRNISV